MTIAPTGLRLRFADVPIEVEASDDRLLRRLSAYFADFVSAAPRSRWPSTLSLTEGEAPEVTAPLVLWDSRGKESYGDTDGFRLVRKDRTGVLIRIHGRDWAMEGPLNHNFSQVINAIGAMYGLRIMAKGAAMLHASYVARNGKGLAVVGQSGAGKSSVAVRLLEQGFDFVSNDRLILERAGKNTMGHGLPKLPRVNPGTLLGGERTRGMLDEEARARYEAMPREDLWNVEDKYDLDVERTLGRRWLLNAPVACVLVLEWRQGQSGLQVERLRPEQALTSLRGVGKDFGALDQLLTRRTDTAVREAAERLPVFRITGQPEPGLLARSIATYEIHEIAQLV